MVQGDDWTLLLMISYIMSSLGKKLNVWKTKLDRIISYINKFYFYNKMIKQNRILKENN